MGLAITGAACVFPGARGIEAFAALLREGRCAVGPIPPDRWPAPPGWPGADAAGQAGLIDDVRHFDPQFFGISLREAERMDPQQRLLLETCWHALEATGETRAGLAGSATGVYVGIASLDFTRVFPADPATLDIYAATGASGAVAANRISYCFDLRGPSISVDTACSSSLAALHLACRALRSGEVERAIVAGVNLLLAPDLSLAFARAGMLAADGRCKTFDAAADGYVRGEGCGVLVLKRLDAALAGGDPVLAVVRGTAMNQDGRSNGLTAPSGPAQEAAIRAALADAGLGADALDAVELHGTGTKLGDPVEAHALASVLGRGRGRSRARPCAAGSVKTNIGHLEAAAGIAGVIKAAIALRDGTLPPTLHHRAPNPAIPMEELGLAMAVEPVALPEPVARIGVSGFGFGGTNAHAILETAPKRAAGRSGGSAGGAPSYVLPLSAHTPGTLLAVADLHAALLESGAPLHDVVHTASVRRTLHDHRVAVRGVDPAALAAGLRRWAATGEGAQAGRRPAAGPPRLHLHLAPLPPSDVRPLAAAGPAGAAALASVEAEPAAAQLDEAARDGFATLLAVAAAIRAWGVVTAASGSGIGAGVAAWYNGQASIGDALRAGGPGFEARPRQAVLAVGLAPEGATPLAHAPDATLESIHRVAGALHAAGYDLAWGALQPAGEVAALPAYPFERHRCWPEAAKPASAREIRWLPAPGFPDPAALQALEDCARSFAAAALRGLSAADVAPTRRPAFERLARALQRDAPVEPDPSARLAALAARVPDLAEEAALLGRTGPALAGILRGDVDSLTVLFPGGDLVALRRLYGEAAGARRANAVLAAQAAARAPDTPGRPLRVLEVGAGTGGSTAAVLDAFGRRPVDYAFTDVSDRFLADAARALGGRGVACRRLDIAEDPAAQGFAPGGFDLVVAANALHATPDLGASLEHCRRLLAPGGSLLLLEAVREGWFLDATFGLTDGWWRFADRHLRRDQPLLDVPGWLGLLRSRGFATAFASPCDAAGHLSVIAACLSRAETRRYVVRGGLPGLREALGDAIRAAGNALADDGPCDAVLDLGSGVGEEGCSSLARLVRDRAGVPGRLFVVTSGAVAAGGAPPDPAAAAVWGLGRTAARETPASWGGLIDLPPEGLDDRAAAAALLAAAGPAPVPELAIRGTGGFAPAPQDPALPPGPPFRGAAAGTYRILGGFGGIGRLLARWLAERGARRLVLAGRRPPAEAFGLPGATVVPRAVDAGDPDAVRALVAELAQGPALLRGVVHAAGGHSRALLADAGSFAEVMRPKLAGAAALDAATRGLPLDLFLLVSSAAGTTGLPGAAGYTAANAALDALAAARRHAGCPALSLALPPVEGVGLAAGAPPELRRQWAALGGEPIEPEAMLAALEATLAAGASAPAHVILSRAPAGAAHPAASAPAAAAPATPAAGAAPPPAAAALPAALGGALPAERPALVEARVAALAAAVLRLPAGAPPDPDRPLQEQGLDSLMALELHGRLQQETGLVLPATLALERPSVRALAEWLSERLSPPASAVPRAPAPPTPPTPPADPPGRTHAPADGAAHGAAEVIRQVALLPPAEVLRQLSLRPAA